MRACSSADDIVTGEEELALNPAMAGSDEYFNEESVVLPSDDIFAYG